MRSLGRDCRGRRGVQVVVVFSVAMARSSIAFGLVKVGDVDVEVFVRVAGRHGAGRPRQLQGEVGLVGGQRWFGGRAIHRCCGLKQAKSHSSCLQPTLAPPAAIDKEPPGLATSPPQHTSSLPTPLSGPSYHHDHRCALIIRSPTSSLLALRNRIVPCWPLERFKLLPSGAHLFLFPDAQSAITRLTKAFWKAASHLLICGTCVELHLVQCPCPPVLPW